MADHSCAEAHLRSFSRQLNDAVRSHHVSLNKSITSRLPLCLPPHTDNPQLYVLGMIEFSRIYEVFEQSLAQALSNPSLEPRLSQCLELLQIPALHRTARIQQDLTKLQTRCEREEFLRRCKMARSAVESRLIPLADCQARTPHLIVPWAWAMYLAIFNGGRWIRKQLRDAGEEFWRGPAPLTFWEFDGDQDGDDVHQAFKVNFEEAAQLLTREEWTEVLDEAPRVFGWCSELVNVLDESTSSAEPVTEQRKLRKVGLRSRLWTAFGYTILVYWLSLLWQSFAKSGYSWRSSIFPVVAAYDIREQQ